MKKSYIAYLFLAIAVLFSSCEKGQETIEYEGTVYIPLAPIAEEIPLLGESTLNLYVYRAGINQASSSVTVSVAVDEAILDSVTINGQVPELLPSSFYTIASTQIQISGSEERSPVSIQLNGIDESFVGQNYVLPITIESVTPDIEILESQRTALLYFTRFRNVYESKYKALGTITPSGSADPTATVDEEKTGVSLSANSIQIKGAENDMNLILTINDGQVDISAAAGSEAYAISNTSGTTSTYEGSFDETLQTNVGIFNLFYTYTKNGEERNVVVELKSWL